GGAGPGDARLVHALDRPTLRGRVFVALLLCDLKVWSRAAVGRGALGVANASHGSQRGYERNCSSHRAPPAKEDSQEGFAPSMGLARSDYRRTTGQPSP